MTTAPARKGQELAVSSPQLPGLPQTAPLPAVLAEARKVDGFQNPLWTARALAPAENVSVQQALAQLEARAVPARDERVIYHIARLLAHWNERKGQDQDSVIDDWADSLTGFSESHIAEACKRWRDHHKFRPTIAELREIIESIQTYDRIMGRRARVLLGLEEPRHWERIKAPEPERKPMTPARRAEIENKIDQMGGPLAGPLRAMLAADFADNTPPRITRRRLAQE